MPLIDCEFKLVLTWFGNYFMASYTAATTFGITDTNLYILVTTLSTDNYAKLLQYLISGFKLAINWNKYQLKASIQTQNQNLDYLVDPSFQRVYRLSVLSLPNGAFRTIHTRCFLLTIEIKDCNVMIDRRNVFNQPVKNDLRTYGNI